MASAAIRISGSNTNQWVSLKTKYFKTLHITNIDTEEVQVNVAVAKDDNVGGTSNITTGFYLLYKAPIPVGVSLQLHDFNFMNITDKLSSGLNDDDQTDLINCTAANKDIDVFIDYGTR